MKVLYKQPLWMYWSITLAALFMALFILPNIVTAKNIIEFRDTLSDSGPLEKSNHKLAFTINTDLSPGSAIEITPPNGFSVLSTSTFAERNVELWVNGVPRSSAATAGPGIDQVDITIGSPGFIRYTLAPDLGIASGSRLEMRIGNNTSTAIQPSTLFSTSTGTTTTPGDIEPIVNSAILGKHDVKMEIYDGSLVANAGFVVFLNEKVNIPNVDTTEEIPPVRFNGSPTSTVGGTTLSVEISLETDEFAVCRYSTSADVAYGTMTNIFSNTGLVFHSNVIPVTPNSVVNIFVRCMDDEGNFNIDDYLISFTVSDTPTGISNTDGDVSGDGTGSGNDGAGSGSGGGGTSGASDGEEPIEGGSSGSGGSGGGGGGGSGGSAGTEAGGGFESTDAPYRSGDGRVIINGYAYPQSDIVVLVDGQEAATTKAGSTGSYSVTLDEIARGAYTFGVYAKDSNKVKSSTFSTSFTVSGARASNLSNINIAPSILVKPDPVNPGEALTISGFALPNAEVTIENSKMNAPSSKTVTATSNSSGAWSTPIDTGSFSNGTYQVRVRAVQAGGKSTNFSNYTFYGVGQEADLPINADLNSDKKVNLIDFSILLFWWNTSGGDSNPPADINLDGNVSLTDFSILLFNWTG